MKREIGAIRFERRSEFRSAFHRQVRDLVLCNSQQLFSGCTLPASPLTSCCFPNAPGHAVDSKLRAKTLARRASASKQRLHVLYLGRLDRQKGMDRLADLIRQSQELDLPIDWRVVGSAITGDSAVPATLRAMLEPPVFEGAELSALFACADVMVLLSDYEGVPLSILEAQRLGVIVIATDVGALPEIVSTGRNGYLVDRASAVEQTISLLTLLAETPALRARVAAAAANVAEWPEVAAPLLARMAAMVDARRKPQPPAPNRALAPLDA